MPVARLHAVVRGNVQGVFFRAHTEEVAGRLGLTGWVRNMRDGGVEVVAEGEREKLEELLAWLRRGPPLASVSSVEHEWLEFRGEFSSFSIRYGWE